jgi:hypothetical protein
MEGRTAVGRTAIIRVRGVEPAEVMLVDVTRNGARIITDRELVPGDEVTVGIAGIGSVAGRVVWHGEQGYGCRFNAKLPIHACTAAVRENVVSIGVDGVVMPPRSWGGMRSLLGWRVAILAVWCLTLWLCISALVTLR